MPEIQFKGKEFVYNHHVSVPFRPLVPDTKKSVTSGKETLKLDGNLIIHGDNLHALKALMPMYAGKVNCIFIDPPYNTGNEGWCYNDNVNAPYIKEWLISNPVNKDDMLRHDKWLTMMFPRLRLLHELLDESGCLWMTLDDNEIHQAKSLLDEIFGETNFIAQFIRETIRGGTGPSNAVRSTHDYVICFAKNKEEFALIGEELTEELVFDKEDEKGPYCLGRELNKWGAGSKREDSPSMWFPIKGPNGVDVYPIRNDGTEGRWRWGKTKLLKAVEDGDVEFEQRADGTYIAYHKIREAQNKLRALDTLLIDGFDNASGTESLKQIFNGVTPFNFPKPVNLIQFLVSSSCPSDGVVLDSFAGSGTTAHAVLALNAEDGGTRRFILVEGEDYADTLTAERVRRVMQGYQFNGKQKTELFRKTINFTAFKKADEILSQVRSIENLQGQEFSRITKSIKNDVLVVVGEKDVIEKTEGLGGTFTYCTLGDPINIEKLLSGSKLPSFEQIGGWLFNTATNEAFNPSKANESEFYLGESGAFHVWLYYKPNLDYLKSRDAALTLNKAEDLAKKSPFSKTGKRHLVFAPAKFVPNRTLHSLGVEYAPLPFALFKIER